MATFRDLLAAAKSEIREIDPEGAAAQIDAGALVLDVREPDEYDEGAILGAIHIPRGHLEAQIENRIADKSAPIVVLLRRRRALGVRREDACRARLHRRRVDGRWFRPVEGRGPPVEAAGLADAGAEQPLQAPPAAARSRRRGSGQAARGQGADARRRRPRFTGGAVPGRRRRRHDRHRRHGRGRLVEPAAPDPAQHRPHRRPQGRLGQEDPDDAQPRRRRRHLRHPPRRVEHHRHHLGLRRDRRRRRQLPEPVPAQRRQREARHPRGARIDLPVRGHGQRVPPDPGPDVPRHGAASPRRPNSRRAAPRPACSACCPASSDRSRRSRRSR